MAGAAAEYSRRCSGGRDRRGRHLWQVVQRTRTRCCNNSNRAFGGSAAGNLWRVLQQSKNAADIQ